MTLSQLMVDIKSNCMLVIELGVDVLQGQEHRQEVEVVDLAMPVLSSPKKLRQQEKDILDSGVLSNGDPCAPLTVKRYKDGKRAEVSAHSRRFLSCMVSARSCYKAREMHEAT